MLWEWGCVLFLFRILLLFMNSPPNSASLVAQRQRIHLQCKRRRRCRLNSWVRKIPWRRKWQPTPVSLPARSHGQRSLAGYSPSGHKESDTTKARWRLGTPLLSPTCALFRVKVSHRQFQDPRVRCYNLYFRAESDRIKLSQIESI